MTRAKLPPEFLRRLKSVKGKRSRVVIDHILKHGFITTEELQNLYGYNHPPRAIRDVREQGIPLETFSVKNAEGRSIAAYRFTALAGREAGKAGGRKAVPKAFKQRLIEQQGNQCAICLEEYSPQHLQVDHRVPYEVGGDTDHRDPSSHMALCGSCNRAKSWSCEHCQNWLEDKNPQICKTCYWANPESYEHIAMRPIRRLDLVWAEDEVEVFEHLKKLASTDNRTLPDYVKETLRKYLEKLEK